MNDVIAVIERDCGRRARIEHGPSESGDVVTTLAETTKAASELGYRPCVDLERGLWHHARSLGLLPAYRGRRSAMAATPRVLLYSHDTFGLGHLRRNLAIAANLLDGNKRYDVTLLSGSPVLTTSPKPPGLRVVALPPVVKVGAEQYRARNADLTFEGVKAAREAVIRDTIASFAPDLFLVDHAPAGMCGELLEALAYLRREMPDTKVAIGLRDIVDEPAAVRSLWRDGGVYDLLAWAYDRILVYGTRHLFDVGREYGFDAALVNKVRYCGYVARKLPASRKRRGDGFSVLVTTGGGGDGFPLVRDYLDASRDFAQPGLRSTVVLGPLMDRGDRDRLDRLAEGRDDVRVVPYAVELLDDLHDADLVVAMGGYNTTAEIIANRKAAIVVPRVAPRQEQLVRARILRDLGFVWLVEPGEDVVTGLRAYVGAALAGERPERLSLCDIDVGGAAHAGRELDALLQTGSLVEMVAS